MNKLNSTTSSYNSGTSSETSETLSIEEAGNQKTQNVELNQSAPINAAISNSRLTKNWKRMKDSNPDKDNDSKRPPWRALNIPPTPKPDRGVLLRAKLLDASRRLRFSKVAVAIQTEDTSSAITRDANVGGQTDLILFRDAGCGTDGAYIERRCSNTGDYILTYSVSQMTDAVDKLDVSTQTLLPRMSGDAFLEAYFKRQTDQESLLQECTANERTLLQQLHNLPETFQPEYFETQRKANAEVQDRGLGDGAPSLLQSTLSSWRFDCDEWWNEFYSAQMHRQPYTITANRPSKSFIPLYESMAPIPIHTEIDWRRLLISVDHLIQETTRYTHNIQRLSKDTRATGISIMQRLQNPTPPNQLKVNLQDNFQSAQQKLPSEHWLPIIEELEKQLVPLPNSDRTERLDLDDYEKFLQDN